MVDILRYNTSERGRTESCMCWLERDVEPWDQLYVARAYGQLVSYRRRRRSLIRCATAIAFNLGDESGGHQVRPRFGLR
jgi:hypothetical protein